jgi:CubicO group peptidase (beta-lactamase class C family)
MGPPSGHYYFMSKNKPMLAATAFSLCVSLMLAGCSASAVEDKDVAHKPSPQGITNIVDDSGISKDRIAKAIAPLFEDPAMSETRAVVIMYRGRLVAERYAPGYDAYTRLISWSMAKSVVGTLVGLMVADGRLALDEPAPVPEWQSPGDPRAKITLRQLLNMASGLDHDEGDDPASGIPIYEADTTRMLFLDGRENVARYAESRPMEAAPGEKFEYSTPTTHILVDIMTRSLTDSKDPEVRRDAMNEYLQGRLFDPLGMTTAFAEYDRNGTMLGGSMIHASARDWAKFGEFLRNNGSVRSAQLLPTSWTRFMKTSSAGDAAYGGQIWLNKKRPAGRDQVLFPDKGPKDVFSAIGHLGQFTLVSPQQQLTVVRLGKTIDAELDPVSNQLARILAVFPKG